MKTSVSINETFEIPYNILCSFPCMMAVHNSSVVSKECYKLITSISSSSMLIMELRCFSMLNQNVFLVNRLSERHSDRMRGRFFYYLLTVQKHPFHWKKVLRRIDRIKATECTLRGIDRLIFFTREKNTRIIFTLFNFSNLKQIIFQYCEALE